ncbi:hypothetical protein CMI47_15405 [Candidatus Pacearchaeota archaeon]|nr:hypothetical protein [Candidatus Pacearchaeota archaeon]|tara:strand:- start:5217 stop:5999 length:783 start_codon:yes stop_codon:yes gene_type:complete
MVSSVLIIIPAHNEETRIGNTLKSYSDFFEKLKENNVLNYEISVIINNTKDNTEEVVKTAKKQNENITYLNFKQGGKGFAVVEGFKDALKKPYDLIGFVDADMATPPEAFYKLITSLGSADCTIASRGLSQSKVETSTKRKITSWGFNFLLRSILLLPIKDTQCGAKLFTRNAVSSVLTNLSITAWAFDIDLLYTLRKKGFRIKEIPTTWYDISGSKIRGMFRVILQMFLSIIRLRLMYSPFKRFIKLYDSLPEQIKIHH